MKITIDDKINMEKSKITEYENQIEAVTYQFDVQIEELKAGKNVCEDRLEKLKKIVGNGNI